MKQATTLTPCFSKPRSPRRVGGGTDRCFQNPPDGSSIPTSSPRIGFHDLSKPCLAELLHLPRRYHPFYCRARFRREKSGTGFHRARRILGCVEMESWSERFRLSWVLGALKASVFEGRVSFTKILGLFSSIHWMKVNWRGVMCDFGFVSSDTQDSGRGNEKLVGKVSTFLGFECTGSLVSLRVVLRSRRYPV